MHTLSELYFITIWSILRGYFEIRIFLFCIIYLDFILVYICIMLYMF